LCQLPVLLIDPFTERGIVNGKSFGLSACTYDCRIAEDLTIEPGRAALASTIERFAIPDTVCGSVLDKSSWARVFVSAFNTHLDPGWKGWLTVELVNLGHGAVRFQRGDPVCQIKFEWLDEPTDRPYRGKYMHQEEGPQAARDER
jgi:dCTP deaminase